LAQQRHERSQSVEQDLLVGGDANHLPADLHGEGSSTAWSGRTHHLVIDLDG